MSRRFLLPVLLAVSPLFLAPVFFYFYPVLSWSFYTAMSRSTPDPIDRLSYQLSAQDSCCLSWANGFWTRLDLPPTSTTEEKVRKYLFLEHRAPEFRIVETRPLRNGFSHLAVLIDQGGQRSIVVFEFGGMDARGYPCD